MVRTHPESGEKVLCVNQEFTTHFSNFHGKRERGFGADFAIEANHLLDYLFSPGYDSRISVSPALAGQHVCLLG